MTEILPTRIRPGEQEKVLTSRKWLDSLATNVFVGGGLGVLIEGTIRMAHNPPKEIFYFNNLDNSQYLWGNALTFFGGLTLAYGISRFIKK